MTAGAIRGGMMERPLMIGEILAYAAEVHPTAEIISVIGGAAEAPYRASYPETQRRVARLAHGLRDLGIAPGDRVATLAWNSHRHFELYYAISGIGAVCHTINPRLSPDQLVYIVTHARDRVIFAEPEFLAMVEAVRDRLPADLRLVSLGDSDGAPGVEAGYEALLADRPESFDWPEFDETTAAGLCYTSGTTGEPKGTLYTHRSTVLHALSAALAMGRTLGEGDRVLPVVPLFHVNAWGLPYLAPLVGASLVMPGGALDGASLFALMDREEVTAAWGVPTVWMGLLAEVAQQGRLPRGFRNVVVGGSAAPRSMIERFEDLGVAVCHAWGMTEMSPVGTHGNLPCHMDGLPVEQRIDAKSKQGRRVFGVDFKLIGEDGARLPHDGKATGELFVRGNTIAAGYFENAQASAAAVDAEGWFATGDIASIDTQGFVQIQDRAKDLVKSGGEWISSIDLENAALSHPGIANCAVIAVPDARWGERPLLVAVPAGTARPALDEIHAHLAGQFAKWQMPDAVEWTDALPLTATGKVSKLTLRRRFAEARAGAGADSGAGA